MPGVPGVSMQQDQSFCFLVSDVGPALPESGDLSQQSVNCLMEELLSFHNKGQLCNEILKEHLLNQ